MLAAFATDTRRYHLSTRLCAPKSRFWPAFALLPTRNWPTIRYARAHRNGMLLQDRDVLVSATVGDIAVCHAIALKPVFNAMQDELARSGPASCRSLWRP
jgi:hypothetical protein